MRSRGKHSLPPFPLVLLTALGFGLSLILLIMLASMSPAMGQPADKPEAPAPGAPSRRPDNPPATINGTVSAREDKAGGQSLTIEGRTVQVTASTTITKAGQTIRLGDIALGDRVSVTTLPDTGGQPQAVTITVLPGHP
jgi:hypothetical protein